MEGLALYPLRRGGGGFSKHLHPPPQHHSWPPAKTERRELAQIVSNHQLIIALNVIVPSLVLLERRIICIRLCCRSTEQSQENSRCFPGLLPKDCCIMADDAKEQQETADQMLASAYAFVWPVAGVSAKHLGQIHRVWLQQQFTPPYSDCPQLWPTGMVQLENVSATRN